MLPSNNDSNHIVLPDDISINHLPTSVIAKSKGLRIVHLNCRSIPKYLDELRILITSSDAHVVSFNETRLCPSISDSEVTIPGYSLIRSDRDRDGGGVLLAIKNNVTFYKLGDGSKFGIEATTAKLSLGSKNLTISTIYRPPSAKSLYYINILQYMEYVLSLGHDTVFVGDYNYNTFSVGQAKKVYEICTLLNLKQLVSKFTRIAPTSSTSIDLVFSCIPDKHLITDVIPISLSDHYLVYTVINLKIPELGSKLIQRRSYKSFNPGNFIVDLNNSAVLNDIFNFNCMETAWQMFICEFIKICNIHAPIRHHRVKNRNSPWMNNHILSLMYKRNALHKYASKYTSKEAWDNYKKARNQVNITIRKSEISFFNQQVSKNKSNSRGMWTALRTVLPSKKNASTSSNIKDLGSDDFNSFFTAVGLNLTQKFDTASLPVINIDRPSCRFSFSNIIHDSIHNLLVKLPDKKGMDLFSVDNHLLKLSAHVISKHLVHLFNVSLRTASVPKYWKMACVTPIYKGKGSKSDPSNYRPISITTTISKLFESIVKNQLSDYFANNNLFSPNQSAFLKGRSTQTALHSFTDYLASNINKGYVSAVCTLDMAKSFDCINHEILLNKLAFYGLDLTSVNWFKSYLTDRMQKVKYDGVSSWGGQLI